VSGAGAPDDIEIDASGLRVAVVATRWYSSITDAMLASALAAAKECGVRDPAVVRVSGAFELPIVARALVARYDAVIALGLVLRGGTPHFEYVCSVASDGLARVALESGVPIGFGLLTCDTEEQARDRSGLPGSREDKGREATLAALETAVTLRGLQQLD
jgi:6,7-dimethyl-8-ribityllumazine synthase